MSVTGPDDLQAMGERLRRATSHSPFHVTVSVAATWSAPGPDPDPECPAEDLEWIWALIDRADHLMYQAKHGGRPFQAALGWPCQSSQWGQVELTRPPWAVVPGSWRDIWAVGWPVAWPVAQSPASATTERQGTSSPTVVLCRQRWVAHDR